MAQTRKGIRSRRLIRDNRGAQAAKNLESMTGKVTKLYDQANVASLNKKLGIKMLTKEALNESQTYKDLAKDIAKVNPSLDTQIMAEIENNARLISDQYMKAYSPDGTPEDMIAFQQLDNRLTGDLNNLTMMVGALDTDLENYDLAKQEDRLIGEYTTDDDLFKYGITNGDSNPLLGRDKNGQYQLTGVGIGASGPSTIVISEYVDNINKKGTGGWKEMNPNLEGQAITFANSIADSLKDQIEVKYNGQRGMVPNPKFNKKLAVDPKTNPEEIMGVESFTFTDPAKARELIQGYVDGNFGNGFKNLTGSKLMPNEEELFAMFAKENSLTGEYDPTRQGELNNQFVDFIVDMYSTGKSKQVVSGGGTKAPVPTTGTP